MKRSTSRMLILAVAATAVLGFSGVASAWYGGGPRGGGPALSPEQQATAQKLCTEHFAATEATRKQLIVKKAELQAAMYGQTPDTQKIEQISKEIGELKGKLLVARTNMEAQMTKEGLPTYGAGCAYGRGDGSGRGNGYGPGYGHRGGHGRGGYGGGPRGGGCWQ